MTHLIPSFPTLLLLEPVMGHFFDLILSFTELACTQTFYFSFRFFFLAVNKSPAVFIFYHAYSTDFEKKIEVSEQAIKGLLALIAGRA